MSECERQGLERLWMCCAALLQLHENGKYSSSLPSTSGRLLLTEKSVEAQTGYNDFLARGGQSLGLFGTVHSEFRAYCYVTSGLHICVEYHRKRKELLRMAFVMKDVETRPSPVFDEYGYVPHEGREWRGSHGVLYHTYLVPENHDLPDAAAFAYAYSILPETKEDGLSSKQVRGSEEPDEDVEDLENESSGENDETYWKLSKFNPETERILEKE